MRNAETTPYCADCVSLCDVLMREIFESYEQSLLWYPLVHGSIDFAVCRDAVVYFHPKPAQLAGEGTDGQR